jgi:hypothetical protein
MARLQLKGLDGLKGLSSGAYNTWRQAQIDAGLIDRGTSYRQQEILYNNQQFAEKYGLDAARQLTYDQRVYKYNSDIINDAFYKEFNPFFNDDENATGPGGELYDASKGMGKDFFKYNLMSPEAKRELLESDWLTQSEIDSKISKKQSDTYDMHAANIAVNPETGGAGLFSYVFLGKDLEESIDRGQNDKTIERIYSADLKKQTGELSPVVDQYYLDNITPMSDDEVKTAFMQAIKPEQGKGVAHIFSAYFNDDGTASESEVENFSIDDMRRFLAKKAVYDYYLGPEAEYDALNNEGKEYINNNQAWYTYARLLGKDIGISIASYTADKWNSVRRLTLLGRDSDVYMTNDGQVVPTADVKSDGDGQYYYEQDGQKIPVHAQTLSLTALDDMGKDGNGNDRGWFNNAQFWTNAEQFGTMDEEEQAQYKSLGYSPYKVVYKPGDETDIWYEALKMTSFGFADMATNLIPMGTGFIGTSMVAKGAKMTGALSKAMAIGGKTLYKTGKVLNPVVSATGIGNAYGRGVYGETFAHNLQQLEQSVADQAQREVYNSYSTDENYKAAFDAEVEQEYQNLLSDYRERIASQQASAIEGQAIYLDNSNIPEFQEELRSRARQNIANKKAQEWTENFKNSDPAFSKALQEASESATDAALVSSLTTAAKYTAVNFGWRKFMFKTPPELESMYGRRASQGIQEITNASGKNRLLSKFDFGTSGAQRKELLKTAVGQFWGGAWTNATDELQSGGGRQMNEDRMGQYIQGMYDGRAEAMNYGVFDAISSYYTGAVKGLANENTYRAGLVGGLGSFTSFAPNGVGIINAKFTKEGKTQWANSSWREKVNMVTANGILNNYYAEKHGQQAVATKVDLINRMLNESNDFEAINQAIALDMASIDATNPEDANALRFLKAVQSIDMLNRFNEDKMSALVGEQSTVMQRAMATIEKLSDPSNLTQEEAADFLAQYYAENPGTAQSEQQNQVALQEMQSNAQELQHATEVYSDIQNNLSRIEKSRGTSIPNSVRARLVQRLTLDRFLEDRTAELEEKITGSSTYSTTRTKESYGDSNIYGDGHGGHEVVRGNTNAQQEYLSATQHLIGQIEGEKSKAQEALAKAEKAMEDYNSSSQNDQGFVKKTELQRAIDNARIQVEYLDRVRDGLQSRVNDFFHYEDFTNEDGTTSTRKVFTYGSRLLSSDEILRLSPEDRARMLDPRNEKKYSEAQREQIKKLKEKLLLRDPNLLEDIQNQANLVQRIGANRTATALMIENPEAAAYQLEADRARQALTARAVQMEVQKNTINDAINKIYNEKYAGKDISEIDDIITKNLRVLNPELLQYLIDGNENNQDGRYMYLPPNARETVLNFSKALNDINNVVNGLGLEDNARAALTTSLDAIIDKASTRDDILNELGKVVESPDVDSAVKAPYETLLNNLEQLWDQRASTTTSTREDREAATAEAERVATEAERRTQEAEEAARKTAEAAAAGITDADADTSGEADAELAAQGLTTSDLTTDNEATLSEEDIATAVAEGEDVELESPSLEEQEAAQPDKVDIRPVPQDDATDQGNREAETVDTYLGNMMYGYELNPLKSQGKQVPRRGRSATDKMSRFFDWMDAAGIKLQDIIDTELGDIMKSNPEVYPLYADYHANATNDDALIDFMLLSVEYTPAIQAIHNDTLGGVVTANGKQYLIIGSAGFAPANKAQADSYRQHLQEDKVLRKQYFDANPSERFWVNTNKHTNIQSATAGRLVRQLATDSEIQIRSISELLSDPQRNPKGLSIEDLKWGIQYEGKFATVNVSERNVVYAPSDGASNLGSVFLLVESANGNYVPAYIRPLRMSELSDGKLKNQINDLVNELTSTDHARRLAAVNKLRLSLNLTKEGDWILVGTPDKPSVSIQRNGQILRTFNLADANFDRTMFLESIGELDPRVNITTSVLSDRSQLEMYDEAGALTTDLAKLGTSGASYNIYAMDADGNPIITAPVESSAPTLEVGSDLVKAQKKLNSERMGNATYRKDAEGNWYTETDKLVTDPRLIEQLNYRNLIRTKGLQPSKTMGVDEIFVVNSDKDNPLVLVRRRGSQIFAMTKDGALKTINEVNAELAEKARQERLKRELEIEESNDAMLQSMTEEEKMRAAVEGEDVDLGETITEDQIVEQLTGNFEAEATPQQRTAEELVEKITTDTADIQLSEDGSVYVDSSGKRYARVTSVIAADEFSDGRFEADNPWGLPSTTIGTGVDEFVRDFFDNKLGNTDNLADRYPNATNEQLQAFAKQLEGLRNEFKRRGLTIVPRDVTVTGAVEVSTKSGEKRVLDVAGTLDLLAYDKDGNFYIFDMKTNRSVPRGESGRKKGAKWSKQLTLYKQLLQEKYGAVVRGLEIIPIQVDYPAPKGWGNATTEYTKRGGQLYADGKEYRNAEPTLHDNIPLPEAALHIDYSKLTPAE